MGTLPHNPIEGQFSDAEDEAEASVANLKINDAKAGDTSDENDGNYDEYDYEGSDEYDEDYDYWDENIDGRGTKDCVNISAFPDQALRV